MQWRIVRERRAIGLVEWGGAARTGAVIAARAFRAHYLPGKALAALRNS